MTIKSFLFSLLVTLSLILLFPTAAQADGIIIPDPIFCDPPPCPRPMPIEQLEIRYHHVDVTIKDQLVVTHVDQVFYNPHDWQIEGIYIFPIPVDAVINDFILWIDGEEVRGQVLEANQARSVYEDIVNSMRDPALLEYIGRGAVQARIFPIPAQGERRIELEYTQVLTAENDLVQYVYPLSTEKFSLKPLESVIVNVQIESRNPIRAIYSPTHEIAISRDSLFQVRVGYEASNIIPDTDFTLYYSLGESEALHVMSYRDPTDPEDGDGFFLILLAPRLDAIEAAIPKDIILVLDQSGSMDGEKFHQAQEALHYILDHLNDDDRFSIISFSTGTHIYAENLRPASEAKEALRWVDELSAQGSTDINRALLEAAYIAEQSTEKAMNRPTYLIFLTDGLPTEGEVDSQKIFDNFHRVAPKNLRLFAFGVGYDVDTYLLDTLAQENHGVSSYVLPDERIDEKLSAFYAKISTPVLTNLSLDFENLVVYDLYPNPLPDLFVGSQIVVLGRYKGGGQVDMTLKGEFNNELRSFDYEDQTFEQSSRFDSLQSYIPRLWATRKIGHLLSQIRLNGPDEETIDQIVRLSIRYGIVTPYTSYLVTEEMALGEQAQDQIAAEQYGQMLESTAPSVSGREAVQKSVDESELGGASSISSPPSEVAEVVKIIGADTFVWLEDTWVDTKFDPDQMDTIKLAFLSSDYFLVLGLHPDLVAPFSLGEHVIALSQGIAYEVIDSDQFADPLPTPLPDNNQSSYPISTASVPAIKENPEPEDTPTEDDQVYLFSKPCLGGFLPLVIFPVGVILVGRRRRKLS